MRLYYLFIPVFVLALTGCSTPKTSINTVQLDRQLERQKIAIAAEIKSEPVRDAAISRLEDRIDQVKQLALKFEVELKSFGEQVKKLTGEANFWGIETVLMKRAGLAAGVGAAALTVASPANAVWVAGMSGFSGAVNGFSASSGSEGFSKTAVASYVKPVVTIVVEEAGKFSLAKARQYMWEDKDIEKFIAAMEEQQKHVHAITLARIRLTQPVTASDEIIERNEALIKKQEQLIQDLIEKNKTPPPPKGGE